MYFARVNTWNRDCPPPPTDPALERVALLFGGDALARFASAHVCIAGVGAVGAMAAESLARSGVGRLTLVDFDKVSLSNLNRHPFAARSTVGRAKLDVARERLGDIAPDCRVECKELFLDETTIPGLLAAGPYDALLDAIDSLGPKTELLAQAAAIPSMHTVSCVGAARRSDPGAFRVRPLFETRGCPFAQLIRKRLRRRGIAAGSLWAVQSDEPAAPATAEPEENAMPRGRNRQPLGSLHAATAAAGLAAAADILRFLRAQAR